MKEENIGVLSAGERFGFKGFEWIVLDNNVDGCGLAHLGISQTPGAVTSFALWAVRVFWATTMRTAAMGLPRLVYSIRRILNCTVRCKWWKRNVHQQ